MKTAVHNKWLGLRITLALPSCLAVHSLRREWGLWGILSRHNIYLATSSLGRLGCGVVCEMTKAWTRTCVAFWVSNRRVLLMMPNTNLQEQVVTVMLAAQDSWSSSVPNRFHAVWVPGTTEMWILMERLWMGDAFPRRNISSGFSRLSFRWGEDIRMDMSARHAEIHTSSWVSDCEKGFIDNSRHFYWKDGSVYQYQYQSV